MKIALIDADIIVFEACSVYGGDDPFDGTPRKDYTLEDLQNRVLYEVERILDATESEAPIMVFSPDSRLNFRKAVASTYKSNRGGKSTKPALYWELVRWCRDHFPSKSIDGLEGDDVLGIMQTKGDGDTVIVSTDKDMKTMPGRLYNHKKDEFLDVSLNEANWFWMYQTLCGDSTDGYGGCPGIGDKKATAALPPLETAKDDDPQDFFFRLWHEVKVKYKEHYLHDGVALAEAIRQARLARILRGQDYDFDKNEIILWHPTETVVYPIVALREVMKYQTE